MFIKRLISLILICCFSATLFGPQASYAQGIQELPPPGSMLSLSPGFNPVLIKGLKVNPQNPFKLDFIIDPGSTPFISQENLKSQSNTLIKYFLAAFTIPEKDLWVNLSPYDKTRMIADNLGRTEMGRDMLAQDYLLKQLTASLIYPEKELGKKFWDQVYTKAKQLYGQTTIPVNTFNKVWIVAEKADVFERDNVAYITDAHLKVMLEEDYTALHKKLSSATSLGGEAEKAHSAASNVIKQIILPELEKEVNEGQHFAPLRQMFYSMILASWYKQAIKESLLTHMYGNKSKVKAGINASDQTEKDKIFEQYIAAYKKGVFNYIKEDINLQTHQPTVRKYFSGGLQIAADKAIKVNHVLPLAAHLPNRAFDVAITIKSPIDQASQLNATQGVSQGAFYNPFHGIDDIKKYFREEIDANFKHMDDANFEGHNKEHIAILCRYVLDKPETLPGYQIKAASILKRILLDGNVKTFYGPTHAFMMHHDIFRQVTGKDAFARLTYMTTHTLEQAMQTVELAGASVGIYVDYRSKFQPNRGYDEKILKGINSIVSEPKKTIYEERREVPLIFAVARSNGTEITTVERDKARLILKNWILSVINGEISSLEERQMYAHWSVDFTDLWDEIIKTPGGVSLPDHISKKQWLQILFKGGWVDQDNESSKVLRGILAIESGIYDQASMSRLQASVLDYIKRLVVRNFFTGNDELDRNNFNKIPQMSDLQKKIGLFLTVQLTATTFLTQDESIFMLENGQVIDRKEAKDRFFKKREFGRFAYRFIFEESLTTRAVILLFRDYNAIAKRLYLALKANAFKDDRPVSFWMNRFMTNEEIRKNSIGDYDLNLKRMPIFADIKRLLDADHIDTSDHSALDRILKIVQNLEQKDQAQALRTNSSGDKAMTTEDDQPQPSPINIAPEIWFGMRLSDAHNTSDLLKIKQSLEKGVQEEKISAQKNRIILTMILKKAEELGITDFAMNAKKTIRIEFPAIGTSSLIVQIESKNRGSAIKPFTLTGPLLIRTPNAGFMIGTYDHHFYINNNRGYVPIEVSYMDKTENIKVGSHYQRPLENGTIILKFNGHILNLEAHDDQLSLTDDFSIQPGDHIEIQQGGQYVVAIHVNANRKIDVLDNSVKKGIVIRDEAALAQQQELENYGGSGFNMPILARNREELRAIRLKLDDAIRNNSISPSESNAVQFMIEQKENDFDRSDIRFDLYASATSGVFPGFLFSSMMILSYPQYYERNIIEEIVEILSKEMLIEKPVNIERIELADFILKHSVYGWDENVEQRAKETIIQGLNQRHHSFSRIMSSYAMLTNITEFKGQQIIAERVLDQEYRSNFSAAIEWSSIVYRSLHQKNKDFLNANINQLIEFYLKESNREMILKETSINYVYMFRGPLLDMWEELPIARKKNKRKFIHRLDAIFLQKIEHYPRAKPLYDALRKSLRFEYPQYFRDHALNSSPIQEDVNDRAVVANFKGPAILLLDKEFSHIMAFGNSLQKQGYNIVFATNAKEALDAFEKFPVRAIILTNAHQKEVLPELRNVASQAPEIPILLRSIRHEPVPVRTAVMNGFTAQIFGTEQALGAYIKNQIPVVIQERENLLFNDALEGKFPEWLITSMALLDHPEVFNGDLEKQREIERNFLSEINFNRESNSDRIEGALFVLSHAQQMSRTPETIESAKTILITGLKVPHSIARIRSAYALLKNQNFFSIKEQMDARDVLKKENESEFPSAQGWSSLASYALGLGDSLMIEKINRVVGYIFAEEKREKTIKGDAVRYLYAFREPVMQIWNDLPISKEKTQKDVILKIDEIAKTKVSRHLLSDLYESLSRVLRLQYPQYFADQAMNADVNGGIDFDRSKMQMNVSKQGRGVEMNINPAIGAGAKPNGLEGFEFQIESIVPISNLPMVLGLAHEEQLALVRR